MFGKHYNDFSEILYNERLGHYMVYVGDTLQGEVISDQEISVSDEIELSTSDDTYFFTFKSPTSISAHATIEIDGNFYKFEILSRTLTVNRIYYSQEVSTQIFESITYENSELGSQISIPRENYKYYVTKDIQNNTQDSFSINGNYVVLNPNFVIMDGDMMVEYDVVINIEYDRLINVIPHYIHWGTSDEIPDLESETTSFYFKDQYEVKAPYIEGFTAVYPAQDEHETNYEKETFLYVPDELRGGGSINLYYFYQAEQSEPEEYKITIHHQDIETQETLHADTYQYVKETELTQIENYPIQINNYIYYGSTIPQDINFYPVQDTEITLYYEKIKEPENPCLSECQNCEGNICMVNCQANQDPEPDPEEPPEEETEDILVGWMISNNNKFAPKTLGENFITDAESKARVFQYGTSAPSKLQKGAVYFVI